MKKMFVIAGTVMSLLATGAVIAADNVAHSGFLPDYTKLKPVEGREGVLRFVDPSIDLRPYGKIYIDPVQVVVSTENGYKGVQPDVLKRMADSFKDSFGNALTSGYQIVPAPGPDVLSIRLAITGIQPVSPPLGVTDFIPIKAIFNAGRAAAGDAPKVAELSAEIEVLDGKGRQAAAVVATRKAEKNLSQKDTITWNDLTPIVDAWSRNFRAALDEARGLGSAKQ